MKHYRRDRTRTRKRTRTRTRTSLVRFGPKRTRTRTSLVRNDPFVRVRWSLVRMVPPLALRANTTGYSGLF